MRKFAKNYNQKSDIMIFAIAIYILQFCVMDSS